jgi:rod shape-determining protein MreD
MNKTVDILSVVLSYVFIAVFFLVQTSFWHTLFSAAAVPNLVMIVVVSNGFNRGRTAGMFAGLVTGLLFDVAFGSLLGLNALMYLLCGYMSGFAHRYYHMERLILRVIVLFCAEFIYGSFTFAVRALSSAVGDYSQAVWTDILPGCAMTVLIGTIIYIIIYLPGLVHRYVEIVRSEKAEE